MRSIVVAVVLFALVGCGSNAMRTYYDKSIKTTPIECLALDFGSAFKAELGAMYHFNSSCAYRLKAEQKSAIVCNSKFNTQQKALGNFPHAYLLLEIKKGLSLTYSYYIDLKSAPTHEDLKEGLKQLLEDVGLRR